MASVGIFFGSDTGNTEAVAKMIQKQLGKNWFTFKILQKAAKKISITLTCYY
ncbi:flavodoxin 1 [Vibrio sp. JCM 19236]|nr:flavodoxin 1 [Vibrio sp. JCM 19236]